MILSSKRIDSYHNSDKIWSKWDSLVLEIRPVSDLRNKFTEIEKVVEAGQPVFLTKNGYGRMVIMSMGTYAKLSGDIHAYMAEADCDADNNPERLTHDQVFSKARKIVDDAGKPEALLH